MLLVVSHEYFKEIGAHIWTLLKGRLQAFPTNISLRWKRMTAINILAYSNTYLIMTVKVFYYIAKIAM